MAYQHAEDGVLVCEECFVGPEDGWEKVTEACLDDMIDHEDGATIRPTCDNCFRAYTAERGWLDAGELEASGLDAPEEDEDELA
jgi:hypothetical protein